MSEKVKALFITDLIIKNYNYFKNNYISDNINKKNRLVTAYLLAMILFIALFVQLAVSIFMPGFFITFAQQLQASAREINPLAINQLSGSIPQPQASTREINLQNLALNRCEQYAECGRLELAIKNLEEAEGYQRALAVNPNYKRVKEIFEKKKKEYVKGLTDRGNQLFLEKKYEQCKKIFNKIILVDPDNLQFKDKIEVCDEQLKILERKHEVYHNPSLKKK